MIEKRRVEIDRVVSITRDFKATEPVVKASILKQIDDVINRIYPVLQGYCVESESMTMTFDLAVSVDMEPKAKHVKVTAKITPPVHEVKSEGKV